MKRAKAVKYTRGRNTDPQLSGKVNANIYKSPIHVHVIINKKVVTSKALHTRRPIILSLIYSVKMYYKL